MDAFKTFLNNVPEHNSSSLSKAFLLKLMQLILFLFPNKLITLIVALGKENRKFSYYSE